MRDFYSQRISFLIDILRPLPSSWKEIRDLAWLQCFLRACMRFHTRTGKFRNRMPIANEWSLEEIEEEMRFLPDHGPFITYISYFLVPQTKDRNWNKKDWDLWTKEKEKKTNVGPQILSSRNLSIIFSSFGTTVAVTRICPGFQRKDYCGIWPVRKIGDFPAR